MISYFSLSSSKLFWLKESLMHRRLNSLWRDAGRDSWTPEELASFQRRKLDAVLKHAVDHVPYYRQWFQANGLNRTSPRLEDFPVIEKKDIRGHEQEFIAEGFERKINWSRTSGSTGEPFRFGRSEYDYAYANLWRGLYRFGIRPGDKRVLVKGVDETPHTDFKTRLKRAIYGRLNRCLVVDAHFLAKSEENIAAELERIIAYRPAYFHGYASSIHLLAQYAERKGIDLSQLKLKAVVTESEKCHDFQRKLMEHVFHASVVENYGCVEFGMIAQPAADGIPCINEDHVYVETLADGSAVFTNLDEYGFPLIRFKNGDLLTLGERHHQLGYRTVASIGGRIAETIHLPQGGSLQGYIVMYPISKHMEYLRQYQVFQPDIDHLEIRIVEAVPLPQNITDQILREMREIVGSVMKVSIVKVKGIPLTKRGKCAFVISEVKR